MLRSLEYRYVSLGHELSLLCVAYADAECCIEPDTEKHLPAALGLYDIWHEVYADRNEHKSWNGVNGVIEFLSELQNGKVSKCVV